MSQNLREIIQQKQQQAFDEGRFSLFHAKFFNDALKSRYTTEEFLQTLYEMVDGWDKYCHLPYDVGVEIDKMSNDPAIVIGVHRRKVDLELEQGKVPKSEQLDAIMQEGLPNPGHTNNIIGSAYDENPDLATVVTPLKGLGGYINFVAPYKNNNVIILTAFPRELVDEHCNMIGNSSNIIYDKDQDPAPKIKPEYIIGTIYKAGSKSVSKEEMPITYELFNDYQSGQENISTSELDQYYTRDQILAAKKQK